MPKTFKTLVLKQYKTTTRVIFVVAIKNISFNDLGRILSLLILLMKILLLPETSCFSHFNIIIPIRYGNISL